MANVLQVIGLNTVTPQLEAGQTSNLDTYSMVSPLTIDPSGTAGYSGTNALTVTGNVSATSLALGTAAGLTLTPTTTGLAPSIAASGTDTNIPIALQSKGTGGIDLTAGANGLSLTYGTVVSGLQRVAVGSGYTSVPTVAISAPNLPSGVQATATVPISVVVTPTVSNTGTSGTYNTGDVLTVSGGTFTTAATITITASGGLVTGVSAFTSGAYTVYPGASPVATTSIGTGVGATFTLVFGISNVFTITAAGSGYVEQPTVTLSSGGGSGASVIAQLGTASGTNTTAVIRTPNQNANEALQFRGPFGNSTAIPMLSLRDIASADSYLRIQNGIAFANIYPIGNANAVLGIYANGTGQILLGTGGANQYTQCRIVNIVSPVNYVTIQGSTTGNTPAVGVGGNDTNISLNLVANGTGAINLRTGATTATQVQVTDTASAVNYLSVTGAVTTAYPLISSAGSDANIGLTIGAKGTGLILFRTGSGYSLTQFAINHQGSAVNYIQAAGAITTAAPSLTATGTDTNVSLNLVTKGTGTLQINGTAWQKTNTLLFTQLSYYIAPSSTATTITVTGASWASNVATLTFTAITTAIPIGTVITVTGMTPSGYNVTNAQIIASSTTSVAFALFTNPGAFSVGGTITGGNTYTPSSGAVVLDVLVCSGGGGGGGGVVNAASVSGGASGGGGGSNNRRYRTAEIGGSATISLGAGGLSGGVGVAGGAGSQTLFTPLAPLGTGGIALTSGAGGGGYFGGIASNTGGGGSGGGCYTSGLTGSATAGGAAVQGAGVGGFNGASLGVTVAYNLCGASGTGGGGGAIGATGADGANGVGFSATGGGSGGGNAAVSGGNSGLLSYGRAVGGAAGAAGANAITIYPLFQGQGGAGGGGATTGTAGAGGNGFNGGGGGGGGSSASGTAAAGGKGGDGFVSIVEYF